MCVCVCVCVCVAFVDLTPVLFKESSLIASKSKDILESKFLISVNYPVSVIKIAAVTT